MIGALVILNACMTALNVVLYVSSGSLISLGAAIIYGCCFLFSVVMASQA